MRTDPTFTSGDLIRMWTRNLTPREQEEVRCFFLVEEIAKRDAIRGIRLLVNLFSLVFPGSDKIFDIIADAITSIQDAEEKAECLRELTRKGPERG